MKDKISIIVPIYNVEKYLERCIISIINQTYTNLEIILVDDGSTDGCPDICEKYKKQDDRIVVLHKKNGGLSDARNKGIDIATGKYIYFIDSDDYMHINTIKFLIECINQSDADISCCSYLPFYDNQQLVDTDMKEEYKCFDSKTALENLLYQKDCTNSAWGKLYKAALFKDIRYPVGQICEDLPVTYQLFHKAKKVCISSAQYYYYYQRQNSIINTVFKLSRMSGLNFVKDETKFIKENHPELIKAAINREFIEAVYILSKIELNDKYKKEINELKLVLKNDRSIVIFDKNSKKKIRIVALLSLLPLRWFKAIIEKKLNK